MVTERYFTGIGSRQPTPDQAEPFSGRFRELRDLTRYLSYCLTAYGWHLRSGAAEGMDTYFEEGALKSPQVDLEKIEIYLPWRDFNAHLHASGGRHHVVTPHLPPYQQAQALVADFHPRGDRLSPGALRLHTRNIFQVLGRDLNTPSKAVFLCAKPLANGHVQGGTNTAVQVARRYGIPCVNLYYAEVRELVEHHLEKLTVDFPDELLLDFSQLKLAS